MHGEFAYRIFIFSGMSEPNVQCKMIGSELRVVALTNKNVTAIEWTRTGINTNSSENLPFLQQKINLKMDENAQK